MTIATTTTTRSLTVERIGDVDLTFTERGTGGPFVILHGGAGPLSVSGFADLLAETEQVRVIAPTHPGFGGTPRPDALDSIRGLAALYVALLDELELTDVTVIGNSIGGWIAAEMALRGSPRLTRVVLVDAVGIDVAGHPVADFFSLTMDQVPDGAGSAGCHGRQPSRACGLRWNAVDGRSDVTRASQRDRGAGPRPVGRKRSDRRP